MEPNKIYNLGNTDKERFINFLVKQEVSQESIHVLEDNQKFNCLEWHQKITSLIENSDDYTKIRVPRIPLPCIKWSTKSNPIKIQKTNMTSIQTLDLDNFLRFKHRKFTILVDNECFCNALKFLVDFKSYYIEGFVIYTEEEDKETAIVPHAWNMIDNKFIDITYEMFIPEYYSLYSYYMYLRISIHHFGNIKNLLKIIKKQNKKIKKNETE